MQRDIIRFLSVAALVSFSISSAPCVLLAENARSTKAGTERTIRGTLQKVDYEAGVFIVDGRRYTCEGPGRFAGIEGKHVEVSGLLAGSRMTIRSVHVTLLGKVRNPNLLPNGGQLFVDMGEENYKIVGATELLKRVVALDGRNVEIVCEKRASGSSLTIVSVRESKARASDLRSAVGINKTIRGKLQAVYGTYPCDFVVNGQRYTCDGIGVLAGLTDGEFVEISGVLDGRHMTIQSLNVILRGKVRSPNLLPNGGQLFVDMGKENYKIVGATELLKQVVALNGRFAEIVCEKRASGSSLTIVSVKAL